MLAPSCSNLRGRRSAASSTAPPGVVTTMSLPHTIPACADRRSKGETLMERARIVVCDDEPGLRDMVQEYLTAQDYTVQAAENGAALRRLVPAFRPDLVVLDVNMPGEDGLSLTRWLRSEEHC